MTYTVVLLHEADGRYSAVVPALDVASWGYTVPEALRMVEEAISCHTESLRELGQPVPADADAFTVEMGDATDAVIYKVSVSPEAALHADADLPPAVLRSIVRQAGLTVSEFTHLLRQRTDSPFP